MFSSRRAISQFVLTLILLTSLWHPVKADILQKQYVPTPLPHPILSVAFEDSKHNSVSLSDFRGRYVLLNLWATWCGPCVEEMPALDELQAQFDPKHLQVIALIEELDGLAAAQAFYTRHGLKHMPIFVDKEGQAPALLQARGLPTTLLIGPDGREIGRAEGDVEWSAPASISFLKAQMELKPLKL